MPLPEIHLSRPAVVLPGTIVDNEETIARVKNKYTGTNSDWEAIENGIRFVLNRCGTDIRYMEDDRSVSPGQFAARAVQKCLDQNGMSAGDIDLLVYGGIARENFEPSTASEVSGRIGASPLHAFDVTCACAGVIEALHAVAGYFAIHPELKTAIICSGEVSHEHPDYDIQAPEELATAVAGLTLGCAAVAFVVTREALPAGSARIVNIRHKTLSEHYELCYAPVSGGFVSHSVELFALAVHVPPEVRELTAAAGWEPHETDHFAFHQPSKAIIETLFDELGAKEDARVYTHDLYANTASTAWALALGHRLNEGTVKPGDKIVGMSAAAGFTINTFAAVWDE